MKFYFAGYYLVESSKPKDYMKKKDLPDKLYSISDCICSIHPEPSALSWTSVEKSEKDNYQKRLQLSDKEFASLQEKMDLEFENETFGWSSVFLNLDSAKNFKNNYLNHLDVKLLSISTPLEFLNEFLEEEITSENIGNTGLHNCFQKKLEIDISKNLLGYEILGYDIAGFHSYLCNNLHEEFNKLGIQYTKNGYLKTFDDSLKAYKLLYNPDEVGAEPAHWLPYAVNEVL